MLEPRAGLDPENQEVLAALRRLQGRGALKRLALHRGVAAAAVAGGLAGAAPRAPAVRLDRASPAARARGWRRPRQSAPAPGSAGREPPVPARRLRRAGLATTAPGSRRDAARRAEHPAPRASRQRRARAPGRPAVALAGDAGRRRRRPPIARARRTDERIFTLGPTPQNVDVYLDGEKQFAYDTDHKTISVPWSGNHTIELRSPAGCCFSERIDVGPDRPLPPDNIIARQLKWKPARLIVTHRPAGARSARVMVQGPDRARPRDGRRAPARTSTIPF